MAASYDLAGRVTLGVADGVDDATSRFVARQMDPFAAGAAAAAPDVLLEPGARPQIHEVTNPANDGLVTGSDGSSLYVGAGAGWCRLPDGAGGAPLRFAVCDGFPLARVFGLAVRPALQIALLSRGAAALHSAAVELDGGGVVVAGWSESGKTETALALMEGGAGFLSDKWTVWGADAALSAFPINVGIRRWVLPYLPRLKASLGRPARVQFAAAAAADHASRPLRGRSRGGRVVGLAGEALDRAVTLADRAALTPTQLRAVYGQRDDPARRVPVRCVVLLANVRDAGVSVREADPRLAAERLARSAAYERRGWFQLRERARYALGDRPAGPGVEEIVARERAILEPLLAGTRVLAVRAPFPTDPRRVAAAIAERL